MKILAISLLILMTGGFAHAAKFAKSKNFLCKVTMNGEIELGDKERLEALLQTVESSWESPISVCLNSPGGNYQEGLRLARLFFEGGVGTVVMPGSQCYSTCAILFMFGSRLNVDSGRSVSRRLAVNAALGFHAPFLGETSAEEQKKDFFKEGVGAIRKFLEVIYKRSGDVVIAREDLDKFFPPELVINMLLMEPSELFLIKTANDVGRWDIQLLTGPVNELRTNNKDVKRQLLVTGCSNAESWWLHKQDAVPMKDHPDSARLKELKPVQTKAFPNSRRYSFEGFGRYETPSHCVVTEFFRPDGNNVFIFQFDDRYQPSSWFSDEFPPHDSPRTSNESWVVHDPTILVCDQECQKVRPFVDVK